MNMASSSSEPSAHSIPDLATLISEGTVTEGVLKLYAEKGQVDISDKDGRTPLMIACLKGLEDIVKFLIANGANPNSKCLKDGNTPMHYACTVEGKLSYDNPSRRMASKIAIINLLLSSGAQADQENLDGWTPPCIAALYMMVDVVDLFLNKDAAEIPLEMKIKITEILGVSQALCTVDDYVLFNDVFCSFSRAIDLRKDAVLPKANHGTWELVHCFNKVSLKECHTLEEINLVEHSELGLNAHAFLVGDRVFSEDLKQKYLYSALTWFGRDLMWELEMLEEGFQVLSFAIGIEHRVESNLGAVVTQLAYKFGNEDAELSHQYLRYIKDLLCEYESVLNHVDIDSLSDRANSFLESFGSILYHTAYHSSIVDILRSTLQTVESLVLVIRGRIQKEKPDKYQKLTSVTFKIMLLLTDEFLDCMISGRYVPSRSVLRVKFVIRKALLFDTSASCRDRYTGDTLLHCVANCVSGPRHLEHLEDLAWVFVRHGCPTDVVNRAGETAREFLMKEQTYDSKSNPRLLTLVSSPTTAPTLEELAIRQILQKDISYLGEVPTCLYGMIRGGLKDSDLERANDEASDEDMA